MLKKHRKAFFIISLLTLVSWHKVLFQSFMGEGFFYFRHGFTAAPGRFLVTLLRYDTGPRLLFDLLKILFEDKIQLYQFLLIATVILIGFFLYFLVYQLSNKRVISILTAILFSVSYKGSFEMLARGNYQFFVQRVFELLFLLPAYIFYIRYRQRNNLTYYLLSLILFVASIIYSQFTLFFVPFMFIYIFSELAIDKEDRKEWLYKLLSLLPFAAAVLFLLTADVKYGNSFLSSRGFSELIRVHGIQILNQTVKQLTVLTLPPGTVDYFRESMNLPHEQALRVLSFPTVILYLSVFFLLYMREKKMRKLLITAYLFVASAFLLNLLMRWGQVTHIREHSRYFYVPSLGLSIVWAVFIYSALFRKGFVAKIMAILLMVGWFTYNTNLIWKRIDKEFYEHTASKISLRYIKDISPALPQDAIVIGPKVIGYHGANFIEMFYGKEKTWVAPFFGPWDENLPRDFDPSKDIILTYNYKDDKVIDRTKDYREIIKQKKRRRNADKD